MADQPVLIPHMRIVPIWEKREEKRGESNNDNVIDTDTHN